MLFESIPKYLTNHTTAIDLEERGLAYSSSFRLAQGSNENAEANPVHF
jgi:hypothetical protein